MIIIAVFFSHLYKQDMKEQFFMQVSLNHKINTPNTLEYFDIPTIPPQNYSSWILSLASPRVPWTTPPTSVPALPSPSTGG